MQFALCTGYRQALLTPGGLQSKVLGFYKVKPSRSFSASFYYIARLNSYVHVVFKVGEQEVETSEQISICQFLK